MAVVAAFVLCWFTLCARILYQHPNESYGGRDEIKYVLLSQMLLDSNVRPPVTPQYPPGWPALLSANLLLGGNVATAHLLNFALVCLAVVLTAALWSRHTGLLAALAAALSFAAHRTTLNLGDKLLSEPAFLVCLLTTLIVVDRGQRHLFDTRRAFLAGILAALCRCVRTAGISVGLGLIIYFLTARGPTLRRRLAAVTLFAIPVLGVELWLVASHNPAAGLASGGYMQQWRERFSSGETDGECSAPATLSSRLYRHGRELVSVMIPVAPEFWRPKLMFQLVGSAAAFAALYELLCRLRRTADPVGWITAVFLATIFLWPYYSVRFLWPAVPVLWLYAYHGWRRLCGRCSARASGSLQRRSSCGMAAVAAVAFLCAAWRPTLGREYAVRQLHALGEACAWIEERTVAANVCVACLSSYQVYFLRPKWKIVPFPYRDDPAHQLQLIAEHKVQWLVESKDKADRYLSRLSGRGVLQREQEFAGVVVYRVMARSAPARTAPDATRCPHNAARTQRRRDGAIAISVDRPQYPIPKKRVESPGRNHRQTRFSGHLFA